MLVLNLCARSFCEADSYGIIASQLVKHLTSAGVYVNCIASNAKATDMHSAEIEPLLRRPTRRADGTLLLGPPTTLDSYPPYALAGPKVIVTMWESSRCPERWLEPLSCFDAIVTPSTFCARVFRDCGVATPIHVAPLGVNPLYRYAERDTDKPFTFLAFADRGKRKGGELALLSFLMAFGDDTNYRLVLKGRTPKRYINLTNPNAVFVQRDMTDAELHRLYLECDAMVFPTYGEGWGLPPREFAATGGIALATNHSGTADHLEQWGWPLPYTLQTADWQDTQYEGMPLGEWAVVNEQALAEILREVANNREQYRAEAKQKAAFAAGYSWQAFAQQVLGVWEGVRDGERTRLQPA